MPDASKLPDARSTQAAAQTDSSDWGFVSLGLLLAVLGALSVYDYAVFHTLVEMFCVAIAAAVWIVVFNTRRLLDNDYLLFVAMGFLGFVVLGIPHILGYKGVQLIPGFTNDLPTQAYIAQRLVLAGSFLIAPVFLRSRLNRTWTIAGFALITGALLLSMLVFRNFPRMFVDGVGLTPLKKGLEYVLGAMWIASAVLLWRDRERFKPLVRQMLIASLGCFAVSEVWFTGYATPFAFSNMLGHLFQVAAFWFVYRAVVVTALVDPFGLLFRELADREASLAALAEDNARALESERNAMAVAEKEAVRTRSLLAAANTLGESTDVHSVLERLAKNIMDTTGRKRVWVRLYDEPRRMFRTVLSIGSDKGPAVGDEIALEEMAAPAQETFAERRALVSDIDALPEEQRGPFSRQLGLRLFVSAPMYHGDTPLGAIGVDDPDEHHEFTDDEISLIEAIIAQAAVAVDNARLFEAQMAVATENARLFEAERKNREREEALKSVAQAASASVKPAELAAQVSETVARLFGAKQAQIRLLNRDRTVLEAVGAYDPTGFLQSVHMRLDADTQTARAFRDREWLMGRQVDEAVSADSRANAAAAGIGAYVLAPILIDDEPIGTLYVAWEHPRDFTEDELSFLDAVVAQFKSGLNNARLYEAEHDQLRFGQSLVEINEDLALSLDLDTTLPEVLNSLTAAMGATGAFVGDRVAGGWRIRQTGGSAGFTRGDFYAQSDAPSGQVVLGTRRPLILEDAKGDERVNPLVVERLGYRGYAVYPLIVRGEVIGLLGVHFSEPHVFSAREQDFLSRVAFAVSLSEENSRLYKAERDGLRLSSALNGINAAVHSSLDFDEIMERVVVAITDAMGVDASAIHMRLNDHWEFTHGHNLPAGMAELQLSDEEALLSMNVIETRVPVISNDVRHDERSNMRLMERFGVTALVGAPLVMRGEAIGVLFSGCLSGAATFTHEQVDFVSKAAATLALALENARLYQTERDIADRLQEALLAMPEEVAGIEFDHAYRSATEALRVGGDFYDLFELDEHHVGIVIGDVAGKGVDAAVLTSLVKNTIRAHAHESGKTPQRIFDLTNGLLCASTPVESFVTVFFGILDRRDGLIRYANAGHTTAVMLDSNGAISELAATGPILGAFDTASFDEAVAKLDSGSLLFLYTDGLTEARRDGVFYGTERLFEKLAEQGGSRTSDLIERVLADVLDFSRDRLRDDLAILAIGMDVQGID